MVRENIRRIGLRAKWSWEGLVHLWQTESSLRPWVGAFLLSSLAAILLPIGTAERALLLMGGILVFAFECLNTAVERAVDHISMERHPLAKQAKDTASAAVALAGVAMAVAWITILIGFAA